MLKHFIAATDGTPLAYGDSPWGPMLMSAGGEKFHGFFQSATHTTNTTTILVQPKSGGSVMLTDLVISGEKIAGGIITVRFYDGANSEVIYTGQCGHGTINVAWSPAGRIWGWADAYIDFTTAAANQDATCTVGYVHIPKPLSLAYAAWDALR